jgi:lysophospholipase L1-like esterase
VSSPDGKPVLVPFAISQVTGKAPISISCTPAAGSAFPVGPTAVTCTAVDADAKRAACSFVVTVNAVPRLSVTKFTAFGDSITAGVLDPPCKYSVGAPVGSNEWRAQELPLLFAALESSQAYPSQLRGMMTSRYSGQSPPPDVVNDGNPGERVLDPNTLPRLTSVLNAEAPQVLLLQEGINDLHFGSSASDLRNGLQAMITAAKAKNVQVLLGTLLPERVGACRAFAPDLVPGANDAIRALATSSGVTLVDLYKVFPSNGDSQYIGGDGLHPTAAGYQLMAQTFYDAIRSKYEVTSAGGTVVK